MNDPKKIRAAFYLRVSTSGQTTDNQLHQLEQVADGRRWDVVGIFTDVASGSMRSRLSL